MKKLLIIMLAAGLLISLNACNNSNNTKSSSILEMQEQSPKELIESAMKIYSWFVQVPLEVDYNNKIQDGEKEWFKVKDEKYNTHKKLDNYLRTIFSSDIVDKLWNYNVYKEINGYLYCLDGGRGANIFIEGVKYDTTSVCENKIVYSVTVTFSKDSGEKENPKVFEFVREKIDESWVFTSFPYFW